MWTKRRPDGLKHGAEGVFGASGWDERKERKERKVIKRKFVLCLLEERKE